MLDPISLTLISFAGVISASGAGLGIRKCFVKFFKKKSDTHETATVRIEHADGTTVHLESVSDQRSSDIISIADIRMQDDDDRSEPSTVGQSPQLLPIESMSSSHLQKLVAAAQEVYTPRIKTLSPPPQSPTPSSLDASRIQIDLSVSDSGHRMLSIAMGGGDISRVGEVLAATDEFWSHRSSTPVPPATIRSHTVSPHVAYSMAHQLRGAVAEESAFPVEKDETCAFDMGIVGGRNESEEDLNLSVSSC